MGDSLQMGKTSRTASSHSHQLGLAIPPWVGAMNISKSCVVNSHIARCNRSNPASVVLQCKLVSD